MGNFQKPEMPGAAAGDLSRSFQRSTSAKPRAEF